MPYQRDDGLSQGVAIINLTLAKEYWKGGDPLRDRMQIGAGAGPAFAEPPGQIIGIVGDTLDRGLNQAPAPIMYIPLAQMLGLETALNSRVAPLYWVVRGQTDPRTLVTPISSALGEASSGLPVAHVRTMDEVEGSAISRERFNMYSLTAFGLAGLVIASIGVYGVMSYSVQQRAHGPWSTNWEAAKYGDWSGHDARRYRCVGWHWWLFRFDPVLTSFLFGVNPWDPVAFATTPLILCAVALAAVWIAARRATRVDPLKALRLE